MFTFLKLKKRAKPFLIGVVLIIILSVIYSRKNQNNEFCLKNNLNLQASSQGLFIDPAKKPQPELPEVILVQKNCIQANIPPYSVTPKVLGALIDGQEATETRKIITEYAVEPNDTISLVAQKFDISVNTLLWANDLTQKSLLKTGQNLIIPPVSGVIHHVKAGDTISAIAQKYKGKTEEIISFNELASEGDIYIGDVIIVPGGEMPSSPKAIVSSPSLTQLHVGYFICPIPPSESGKCRLTQGLHWSNAVDFSNGKCGEPVYAAAAGEVLKVKLTSSTSRWVFGGAGNNIAILHPNGVVTTYGHVLTSFVNPGDQVYQGQIIALVGGKPGTAGAGNSTGCHLHFGVVGAKNTFGY